MSKIGALPIIIPAGVTVVNENERMVKITGSKGVLEVIIPAKLSVQVAPGRLEVTRRGEDKKIRALHGWMRAELLNALKGVEKFHEKVLEIQGVGYKVALEGAQKLVFKVGFSHPVYFEVPAGVNIEVKGSKIAVRGVNRQFVGETAAKIKAIRKPDKYKGKGIRYVGEFIKLKPGKKAKAGA